MAEGRGGTRRSLASLARAIPRCRRCPELHEYCAHVAREKRRAFRDRTYWGRPVPGFGDERARIIIVGLAPAAHGANRTGRMFTGDRSGDFLYAALHRAGLANQASSTHRGDGLALRGVYITAALRCAPPANRPTAAQLANCSPYLRDEIRLLRPAVLVCLGAIAWNAALAVLRDEGLALPVPKPKFAHGRQLSLASMTLLGCYHVSQQNTFTGRLTAPMFEAVLRRARAVGLE
jgi:uracil-DNA glycosylase family 4